jgi:hypothetical protein
MCQKPRASSGQPPKPPATSQSPETRPYAPFPLFLEMWRVGSRIYAALERRLWPRDAAQLYLLAGSLSDLMAVAAAALGYFQAAEELIRAGWAYAIVIDHRPLMAHLRLQHASVTYWDDRPRQARDLAESGPSYLANGPNAAHLHVKYAQAAENQYASGPAPGQQHWFGAKALVGIDLATIRLHGGDLDAAPLALRIHAASGLSGASIIKGAPELGG